MVDAEPADAPDFPESAPDGPLRGHLVRFSIGLEEAVALRADLEQALRVAFQ